MTTIESLAQEFSTQPYELRAFADDLLDGLGDTDEIPADAETTLREALAMVPAEMSTEQQNRAEDAVLDEVAEVVDGAGYDY